ncbi:MAG TPA: MFS transporter [Terriglobales bacterium]|nr:MFS transporter [Terriglobales bacterium]
MLQSQSTTRGVTLAAYWQLLRQNRNFRNLWMAQIVSEIGDWFYTLALYSLVLQLTGKATAVGMALMFQVLPQTLTSPIAGVVNDRVSRKRVMIIADVSRFFIVLAMLLVRSRSMVWLVYPLLVMETAMWAFFEPARNAVIPNITPQEDIIVANTLSSTTWSLNLMIGAALGGVVAAMLGRDAVFVLNALSFLASAFLISRMHFVEPHAETAVPLRSRDLVDYSPVLEGVRYVRRDRRLLATMFAKAGEFMIGPSWVLFTVMGMRYFPVHWAGLSAERGALLGMSLLIGARGIGALVGPLVSARIAGHSDRNLRLGILVGYVMIAIGYLALGRASGVWLACLCIVFAHSGGSTVWVFSTTLLQINTEDRFRGRVFAADLALCMLTIGIGAFLCGRFLDWGASARAVATTVGLLMLLPTALWAWVLRLQSPVPQPVQAGLAD